MDAAIEPGATSKREAGRPTVGVLIVGVLLLAVCSGAALMLVLEHLGGLSLPGCGAGSPCARAAESVWGKVPGIEWPVSFIGFAYFLGLLVTWLATRGALPGAARMLIRLGLVLSLGFVLIMIRGGYVCPYCLATHVANLAFGVLVEFFTRSAPRDLRPLTTITGVFVVATLLLALTEWRWRRAALEVAETQMRASSAAILAASTQPTATEPAAATAETMAAASMPSSAPAQPRGFTGRYRLGPEQAPIRIVIFSDYQCKGCNLIEFELKRILEQHNDVSLSVKQWPGGAECNSYITERSHEYACAAARAAEAAGILHGNDGFWQMHFWLFAHSARFTDEELRTALTDWGYDAAEFERVMDGDLTRRLIAADIEEGWELALRTTPLIFVNGVEFKGWSAPLALTRVVDQLSEKKLVAKTAEADHPMPPLERYVADWREVHPRTLAPAEHAWPLGPDDARLTIVIWGDYQQPQTALADEIIRAFVAEHSDAQYTFRAYPLDQSCNPAATLTEYPMACRAAQAALAAGLLGGAESYWKMHDWLLKNQTSFTDDTLRAAVGEMGLDAGEFFAKLDDSALHDAVLKEAQAGQQAGLQHSPLMFLNGKVIPRWMHGQQPLLRPILDAAARAAEK